jgi:hypothetical protein
MRSARIAIAAIIIAGLVSPALAGSKGNNRSPDSGYTADGHNKKHINNQAPVTKNKKPHKG